MNARGNEAIEVRPATEADVPALHRFMLGLSKFEGYFDVYGVTPDHLLRQGFRKDPPDFHALVAVHAGVAVGMLIYYFVPFTMRGRTTFYLKELFVEEHARDLGAGSALMRRAASIARERDCAVIKWQIARWNDDAARFYQRLGGQPDPVWLDYWMGEAEIQALAEQDR